MRQSNGFQGLMLSKWRWPHTVPRKILPSILWPLVLSFEFSFLFHKKWLMFLTEQILCFFLALFIQDLYLKEFLHTLFFQSKVTHPCQNCVVILEIQLSVIYYHTGQPFFLSLLISSPWPWTKELEKHCKDLWSGFQSFPAFLLRFFSSKEV